MKTSGLIINASYDFSLKDTGYMFAWFIFLEHHFQVIRNNQSQTFYFWYRASKLRKSETGF